MDAFAALADPVRRSLLRRLAGGPVRVVDLAGDHDVSRPAVSRHLRVLGDAGLVHAEDRGRERHYSLARNGLAPVLALTTELRTGDPRLGEDQLAGLDLEIRRTVRDHARSRGTSTVAQTEHDEETA